MAQVKTQNWLLSLLWNRRYLILLIWACIFGALIRFQGAFHESLWPDEALYSWCGWRIFSHPGLIFSKEVISFHPPLFSFLIAIANLFLPSEAAARIVSPLFGSMGILLIYFLGRQLKNQFVGALASTILAFHYIHIFDSTRVLIDATLATFYMLLILLLVRYEITADIRKNIWIGLTAFAVIMLKWSGILVIPLLIFYFIFLAAFERLSLNKITKPLFISLATLIILTTCLLVNNYFQLGRILADADPFIGTRDVAPAGYYFMHLADLLKYRYLLVFFLYGLWVVVREKPKVKAILFSWALAVLIGISSVPTKLPRYALPVVPAMLLITGLGIDNALRLTIKSVRIREIIKLIIVILFLFAGIYQYPSIKTLLDHNVIMSGRGYREAGIWIKENVSEDVLILADSPRHLRYFSNINFKEFSGRIVISKDLEKTIQANDSSAKQPLYLVINIWESGLRGKLFDNRVSYLRKLGFKPVKQFDVNFEGNIIPAVLILKREPPR